MSLLDEFEKWLIKKMDYSEEVAESVTRRDWEDDFLDSASNDDVKSILYYMALFAFQKALGEEKLKDKRFEWIFVVNAEMEYNYMELYILEMKTRTVVASVKGDFVETTPKKLEDALLNLINQIKDSEKMLAVRLIVDDGSPQTSQKPF